MHAVIYQLIHIALACFTRSSFSTNINDTWSENILLLTLSRLNIADFVEDNNICRPSDQQKSISFIILKQLEIGSGNDGSRSVPLKFLRNIYWIELRR